MAISTMTGVNTALPGQTVEWQRNLSGASAGNWQSFWLDANAPGAGVAPSSGLAGDVPTKATAGAFPFVNPASGNTYLARVTGFMGQSASASMVLAVYDRLWHNSGINVTIATPQTINSVALTRPDALGSRVEAWWEVYGTMGAGTPTVTLAYTDQDGNTETTGSSGALTTALAARRCGQFQLAAGDTGARSIQTWTASATFSAGTIGLVLRRLVTQIIVPMVVPLAFDALAVGLPRVYDNACLETLALPLATTNLNGGLVFSLIQG